jgi:hypothetical protein
MENQPAITTQLNLLRADMNLDENHLNNPTIAGRIIDLKGTALKKCVSEVADCSSQAELTQQTNAKFDSIFGQALGFLEQWIPNARGIKRTKIKDYEDEIAERNKYPRFDRGEVLRKEEWKPGERFEYIFLLVGAILLWLVGYLSLVQVIHSNNDGSLTPVAEWLLPLAGVTVMALMIKILLSRLQGTKAFGVALTLCIIGGLAASLTWLFCFSGFITNGTSQQVPNYNLAQTNGSTQPAQSAPQQSSGNGANALYIVVSILGEALGAGACYAYAASIAESKTHFDKTDNTDWKRHNQEADKMQLEVQLLDNKIICAESIIKSIENKKVEFEADLLKAYSDYQMRALDEEEKQLKGEV